MMSDIKCRFCHLQFLIKTHVLSVLFTFPDTGNFPGCSAGADHELTGSTGELKSPKFGTGEEYPSDSECGYKITVSAGKVAYTACLRIIYNSASLA